MCRLNDTTKTAYYDITLAILCSVSCIFYMRRFGSFCAPRLKRNYTEFRKNHISQTYVVSHNLDNDQHADNCGVKEKCIVLPCLSLLHMLLTARLPTCQSVFVVCLHICSCIHEGQDGIRAAWRTGSTGCWVCVQRKHAGRWPGSPN